MQTPANEIMHLNQFQYYCYKSRVLTNQQKRCLQNNDYTTAEKLAKKLDAYNRFISDIRKTIDSILDPYYNLSFPCDMNFV